MSTEAKRNDASRKGIEKMKTLTAVVIGLSLTLASAFAAQAPAGNPAPAANTPAASATPARKHVKKHNKAVKNATAATPATPATPAK